MPSARTVLGDAPTADLGICDAHDHLFLRSAQLPGQELDDADAATAELRSFGEPGGQTVVQWMRHGHQDRLGQLAADLASGGWTARPELLADQLSLIMEGTYASAQALSAAGPARHARTLAESLLGAS